MNWITEHLLWVGIAYVACMAIVAAVFLLLMGKAKGPANLSSQPFKNWFVWGAVALAPLTVVFVALSAAWGAARAIKDGIKEALRGTSGQ